MLSNIRETKTELSVIEASGNTDLIERVHAALEARESTSVARHLFMGITIGTIAGILWRLLDMFEEVDTRAAINAAVSDYYKDKVIDGEAVKVEDEELTAADIGCGCG